MAVIKCKMCGGTLAITEGSTIAQCEYCGSVQTIPALDDEKKLIQFERAERLRKQCEFDKAAGVYESIVAEFRQEAEAYWGLVLCKFGIEYVDDPATGKKIPTCHRSSFDSIIDDSDFEQVLENADASARKIYRDEAKQIEEIRKGIIAVSANEDPYDIFICYKETDAKGQRTIDSVMAQNLYTALTEKGYRVFFSRISLEDKLGQEYEPYIFAALNSAKVMLALGTDYEYFNATWVKNEWSRYLKLIAKGEKKTLIPCYKDIDAYDMPKEFRTLQAQDLGKVGATQDLLWGIEKILKEKPQKSTAIAGMTKEEKSMVEAMKESQKKTRALILSILCGAAFVVLCMVLTLEYSFWDTLAYDNRGREIMWTGDARVLVIMFYYALMGMGIGINITYGPRNRLAHWFYLIGTVWAAARIYCVETAGYTPAESLFIYLGVYGFVTLLSALFTYRKKKRK